MSNFEFNKIFAAVLLAGIVAMLSGFIANKVMHPHHLEHDVVSIDGAATTGARGPQKAAMPEPILHLIATADIEKGQKLSKACAACHSFDQGGPSKVGPNIWNIVNADKGGKAGFAYSDAMLAHEGTWSYASLNKFFWKPKNYVPGTKMNYIGLKKPEDRAAIIAWLRTLSSSQAALPSEAEISAEKAELAPEVDEEPQVDAETAPEEAEATTDDAVPAASEVENIEEITPHAGDVVESDDVSSDESAGEHTNDTAEDSEDDHENDSHSDKTHEENLSNEHNDSDQDADHGAEDI